LICITVAAEKRQDPTHKVVVQERRGHPGKSGLAAFILKNSNSVFFHVCGHSPPAASRRLLAYDIPVYVIFWASSSFFVLRAYQYQGALKKQKDGPLRIFDLRFYFRGTN
jgi:hypothetical protein